MQTKAKVVNRQRLNPLLETIVNLGRSLALNYIVHKNGLAFFFILHHDLIKLQRAKKTIKPIYTSVIYGFLKYPLVTVMGSPMLVDSTEPTEGLHHTVFQMSIGSMIQPFALKVRGQNIDILKNRLLVALPCLSVKINLDYC